MSERIYKNRLYFVRLPSALGMPGYRYGIASGATVQTRRHWLSDPPKLGNLNAGKRFKLEEHGKYIEEPTTYLEAGDWVMEAPGRVAWIQPDPSYIWSGDLPS
jgi:hypothetical protein